MSKPFFIYSLALSSLLISTNIWACSPPPDTHSSPVERQVDNADLVFEGVVKSIEDNIATIRVKQYFKGDGALEVQVKGFNTHSCSTFLEPEQQALFFTKPTSDGMLEAVYDGGFGATLRLNDSIRDRIKKNQAQNQALEDKNCSAIFDGERLYIPCIKISGSEDIYDVRLNLSSNTNPYNMGFNLKEAHKHPKLEAKPPEGIAPFYASVNKVEINIMESMPVQVSAIVNGHLLNGCQTLNQYDGALIPLSSNGSFRIDVTLYPPSSEDVVCTMDVRDFSINFPLDVAGLPAGVYEVNVNGTLKTQFELAQDNVLPKE